MKPNIKEVFLMKNINFILLVSYTPGIKLDLFKTVFINELQLKPIMINTDDNTFPENFNSINYDNLNKLVTDELQVYNNMKSVNDFNKINTGIVIFGHSFDNSKLKFKPDIHIHLSLSQKLFNTETDNSMLDYLKLYEENIKNNIINKYFNIKTYDDIDDILNKIFIFIINFWEKNIYKNNYDLFQTKIDDLSNKINIDIIDTDTNDDSDTILSHNYTNLKRNNHKIFKTKDDFKEFNNNFIIKHLKEINEHYKKL
jgi:hypothetical protein